MKKIVIAVNGWVFIGKTVIKEKTVILTDASVIRRWGTERGIGQIAISGPTKDTILDPLPRTEIQKASVIAVLDCEE